MDGSGPSVEVNRVGESDVRLSGRGAKDEGAGVDWSSSTKREGRTITTEINGEFGSASRETASSSPLNLASGCSDGTCEGACCLEDTAVKSKIRSSRNSGSINSLKSTCCDGGWARVSVGARDNPKTCASLSESGEFSNSGLVCDYRFEFVITRGVTGELNCASTCSSEGNSTSIPEDKSCVILCTSGSRVVSVLTGGIDRCRNSASAVDGE